MISKKVISDIVSKYSLGNVIEKVKWVVEDEKLLINFINDSKVLLGYVEYRNDIGLKNGDYGIFNTSQLIKCLNILDGDILMEASNDRRKLNIADTNYEIKFGLSKPEVLPKVPEIKDEDNFSVSFSVNDEFITRFVKSKDALSDLEIFTVETREGFTGEELVFTIGTTITNSIEFTVEADIKESFSSIPFDSNLFKEILKANKNYHSGEIRINKKGLIDAHFHCGEGLFTGYYLVRKQDNN